MLLGALDEMIADMAGLSPVVDLSHVFSSRL